MPGARYTDWTHVHVVGDRAAAMPYLPFARKVLGHVVDEARTNGYMTHQMIKHLDDGAVVIGEVRGNIPRITIVPPPGGGLPPPPIVVKDFVVWARSDALIDGIDAEYPEQILKVIRRKGQETQGVSWETFVKDEGIALGARVGSYGGHFPVGVRHNGNVDWLGPDGERLSWYGPTLRYWCDRWRQPSAMYGRWVFLLGHDLLDIDQYCTDSEVDLVDLPERLVLGACLRADHLYVMQAGMDDMPTGAPVGRPYDVYVSPPYCATTVALRLVKYRVVIDPARADPRKYKVLTGSHETLWTNSGGYTVNPWFFNPAGTACETMVMPPAPHVGRYNDGTTTTFTLPSASHQHAMLAIDPDDDTVTVATAMHALALHVTNAPTECLVATDFDKDGNRLELFFGYEAFDTPYDYVTDPDGTGLGYEYVLPWCRYYLRLGANRINLFASPTSIPENEVWARLYALDLRAGAFALSQTRRLPNGEDFEQTQLYYVDGLLQKSEPYHSYNFVNGGPPFHTGWQSLVTEGGQSTLSPLSMLFGVAHSGIHIAEGDTGFPWAYYPDTGFNQLACLQPAAQTFGCYVFYDETGTNAYLFVDHAASLCPVDAPFNAHVDVHGFTHALGLAADQGVLLFSGPRYTTADNNAGGVIGTAHYATDGALPVITGVTGDNARYHPLWLLGKFPKRSLHQP